MTLTYMAVVWAAVEQFSLAPLKASLIGYCIAIVLSYLGQKYFTFRSEGAHRVELPKFLVTSAISFAGSVGAMAATTALGWDYRVGILSAATLVPLGTFVVMYFWVFRHRHGALHERPEPAGPVR